MVMKKVCILNFTIAKFSHKQNILIDLHFFYKIIFYKNVEIPIVKNLRTLIPLISLTHGIKYIYLNRSIFFVKQNVI